VILAKARPDANTMIDLQTMNQIRKQLSLSPLKSIAAASALMRLWELL
jgi:hypothetical protein